MENNSDKKNRKIKDIYKDVYKCNKYSVQTFFSFLTKTNNYP